MINEEAEETKEIPPEETPEEEDKVDPSTAPAVIMPDPEDCEEEGDKEPVEEEEAPAEDAPPAEDEEPTDE